MGVGTSCYESRDPCVAPKLARRVIERGGTTSNKFNFQAALCPSHRGSSVQRWKQVGNKFRTVTVHWVGQKIIVCLSNR